MRTWMAFSLAALLPLMACSSPRTAETASEPPPPGRMMAGRGPGPPVRAKRRYLIYWADYGVLSQR